MTQKPIVFANIQQSGWEQLAGAPGPAINVVMDGRGTVRRRPGIQTSDNLITTAVDADGLSLIHSTVAGDIYVVSDADAVRKIYRVNASAAADISDGPGGRMFGELRPTVTETEALLVFAGGGLVRKVDLTVVPTVSSALGGTPPVASHMVANDARLLGNDMRVDRTKVRFSEKSLGTADYSGHETWNFGGVGDAGFFSAEARPDPVVALGETTNEVFVFGSTNLQVYRHDGQTAFAPGATREYGCSAPYSPTKVDQAYGWIDHRRRIMVSDGRSFEDIGKEIQPLLDAMVRVDDAFGYRVHEGPIDCLVWCFPTDGRTMAYQRGGGWSTWMGWNTTSNNWGRLKVNCHHHSAVTDENLVGTTDGFVGKLSMGVSDDLGVTIPASAETGFLDRDSDNLKQCVSVKVRIKRGQTVTEEVCQLRYKDQPGAWSQPLPIRLGVAGDTDPVVVFRSLGTYRQRAWKFEFSAATDLVLASVSEEFEVLGQ